MKKILSLAAFLLTFSLICPAAKTEAKYLAGAVPTENGLVVFRKTFSVAGQSDAQLQQTLMQFVKGNLMANGIQELRTRIISDGKEDGLICASIEEWMIFKKKFANLDEARFRYQISASAKGGKIEISIRQISYLYREEIDSDNQPTGKGGDIYRAEEWIDDAHALNKKQTKLLWGSGKFRKKTVDRIEQIFESAMDAFEEESIQQEQRRKEEAAKPAKKVRSFVKE